MSAKELASYIGKSGFLVDGARGFRYRVLVLDARTVYGKVQCDVRTYHDAGQMRGWVDLTSIYDLGEGA